MVEPSACSDLDGLNRGVRDVVQVAITHFSEGPICEYLLEYYWRFTLFCTNCNP